MKSIIKFIIIVAIAVIALVIIWYAVPSVTKYLNNTEKTIAPSITPEI